MNNQIIAKEYCQIGLQLMYNISNYDQEYCIKKAAVTFERYNRLVCHSLVSLLLRLLVRSLVASEFCKILSNANTFTMPESHNRTGNEDR